MIQRYSDQPNTQNIKELGLPLNFSGEVETWQEPGEGPGGKHKYRLTVTRTISSEMTATPEDLFNGKVKQQLQIKAQELIQRLQEPIE